MTRALTQLEPRELDALVAEHVFGNPRPLDNADYCLVTNDRVWFAHAIDSSALFGYEWVARLYSTDPVASKQLRDHMRSEGYAFSIIDDREDKQIEVRFRRRGMDLKCSLFIGLEATEELAVAIAALRAKGITGA